MSSGNRFDPGDIDQSMADVPGSEFIDFSPTSVGEEFEMDGYLRTTEPAGSGPPKQKNGKVFLGGESNSPQARDQSP